jgi:predicted Fe-Mo cluster-binding NifX family protein
MGVKVAIAVEGGQVAPHFGRCQTYLVADVDDGQIGTRQQVDSPGHEPGVLPAMLHDLGVECVIAGGMGPRAAGMFQQYGISTIVGVTGAAHEALSQFASGTLKGGESLCDH